MPVSGLERLLKMFVVVVQSLSHVRLFETPWTAARPASQSFALSLSEFAQTHVH